mmetsp:Transcript_45970/g.109203  ORF Transcript_45970/g.109203 Transcript_45970/m.109203 type:complete len:293 (+) Transcript_45970:589-1467(+)
MAKLMQEHSDLCAVRDEVSLRVTLGWMEPKAQADGHQVPGLLHFRAIWPLFPKDQGLLAGHACLLRLWMVLRKEVEAEPKVPANGHGHLAVQLVQRFHHFVSVLQRHLLALRAPHGAEGEVEGAQAQEAGVHRLLPADFRHCHHPTKPRHRLHHERQPGRLLRITLWLFFLPPPPRLRLWLWLWLLPASEEAARLRRGRRRRPLGIRGRLGFCLLWLLSLSLGVCVHRRPALRKSPQQQVLCESLAQGYFLLRRSQGRCCWCRRQRLLGILGILGMGEARHRRLLVHLLHEL